MIIVKINIKIGEKCRCNNHLSLIYILTALALRSKWWTSCRKYWKASLYKSARVILCLKVPAVWERVINKHHLINSLNLPIYEIATAATTMRVKFLQYLKINGTSPLPKLTLFSVASTPRLLKCKTTLILWPIIK